jgi:ankyrin repeat protein
VKRYSFIVLLAAAMLLHGYAHADNLVLAGKSAKEVFWDDKVVALLKAAFDGDATGVKRYIAGGADINASGYEGVTPLLWAIGQKSPVAVRALLDAGAAPDKYKIPEIGVSSFPPPSMLASSAGLLEILKLLLDHGANPNLNFGNETPLIRAIGGHHLDCAELLLQRGADVNGSIGTESAMSEAMLIVQFDEALWLLNHGYTHDPVLTKRMLSMKNSRPGQEEMKAQALALVEKLLAQQPQSSLPTPGSATAPPAPDPSTAPPPL